MASDAEPTLFQRDDRVFEMAFESVQFVYVIQTNQATARWSWLCKSYREGHVVALTLSRLCIRPLSPETDHAWDLVINACNFWQRNNLSSGALLDKLLVRLMKRITGSRAVR